MNSDTGAIPSADVSFDRFMASLRDPEDPAPIVSVRRFGEALHIDLQTLAQQAHVHRNTISRQPASESVQRFLRDALRVIRAATDISGDVTKALFWYRNEPLPVFNYKTAEQLVSEGRADDVLRYVSSLEAGAAG
jgi:hypothetical protein